MAHTSKIRPLSSVQVTNSTLDKVSSKASGRLSQVVFTVVTTFCFSISTAVWAETKNFDLSGFDGVSAAEGIQMQIIKGDVFKVSAESDDPEQLDRLELDIKRGILRAQMDYGLFSLNWQEKKRVTIRVTMPSLIHAETSTGAKIEADAVSGSAPELAAYSGSSLKINTINGGVMSADVSNGAEIQIGGGTCTSLSVSISGGAYLDMEKVKCGAVKIDASSGSHASVYADKSIEADASTGSRVRVYGDHDETKIDVSSGGKIDLR